jgi:hypothetical protein
MASNVSVVVDTFFIEGLRPDCGPGSVVGVATGYGLDGPGIESRWGRDFPHLSRPALGPNQPPVKMGTGSFPGIKSGRGVTLTPHPLLVPCSWKSRAILLLSLWAIRPVQSLNACTRGALYLLIFRPDCRCGIRIFFLSTYHTSAVFTVIPRLTSDPANEFFG